MKQNFNVLNLLSSPPPLFAELEKCAGLWNPQIRWSIPLCLQHRTLLDYRVGWEFYRGRTVLTSFVLSCNTNPSNVWQLLLKMNPYWKLQYTHSRKTKSKNFFFAVLASVYHSPCWSVLDFWKFKLEKSSSTNWIFNQQKSNLKLIFAG